MQDKTAGPAQEFTHHLCKGNIGLIMPYSKGFVLLVLGYVFQLWENYTCACPVSTD
ncbi:hypothetical protein C427_0271 [Paraglaciecola psychrophila 170]|uniref:Uncharacterized protein n=1 Tax=Paraglaciecola psychrophila 170 TaxID=1129794 RepID=M4RFP6_9ALTE|nr:hypothetical protein C427_0271 [Paraglaciecola psychrophila 170]